MENKIRFLKNWVDVNGTREGIVKKIHPGYSSSNFNPNYFIETGAIIRPVRIIDGREEIVGEGRETFYTCIDKLERLRQTPKNKDLERKIREKFRK